MTSATEAISSDAQNPVGDLVADPAGNLYGTTESGGTYGEGTVFEISASGVEKVLYSFGATPADGREPLASLVRDATGNLYGTTNEGGARETGTVFEVSAGGTETVLYSFTGLRDEGYPEASLLLDGAGNLYGTTADFLTDEYGTVFKLPPGGKITELRTFTGPPSDGANPFAGLIRDRAGTLYGTTGNGGTYNLGAVFKVNRAGADTVFDSFRGGASDGSGPAGNLVRDASGNLYGTTIAGGGASCGNGTLGCGTVFKVLPTGQENVLYTFSGQEDGAMPFSDLLLSRQMYWVDILMRRSFRSYRRGQGEGAAHLHRGSGRRLRALRRLGPRRKLPLRRHEHRRRVQLGTVYKFAP